MRFHQHRTNNSVLGAPPDTSIEVCGALPITRIVYGDGTEAVESYWKPMPYELGLLLLNAPIRITLLGTTHAPIKVEVEDIKIQTPKS